MTIGQFEIPEPWMECMRAHLFTLFSLLLASYRSYAGVEFNLTPGVTPGSQDIYNLHMTVFWVCVVIGVVVFGIMAYSILFHRKSIGAKPARFHEHPIIEIVWTVIPFLILIGLAIPGTRVLSHLNDVSKPDLTIKVTGYQWKWQYDYINNGIRYFSNLSTPYDERMGKKPKNPHYLQEVDNPVVIPIHQKIRFLITSNDVLHSWYVPALGVKRQAIPGYINEIWARVDRPGIYRGQCAELCGLNHGFMPIVVEAKNEKDFAEWLRKKGAAGVPTTQPAVAVPPTPSPMSVTPVPAAPATATPASSVIPTTITPAVPVSARPATSVTTAPAIPATSKPTTSAAPAAQSALPSTAITSPAASTAAEAAPAPTASTTQLPAASTGLPKTETLSTTDLSKDALMKKGEQTYQTVCVACHQPTGEGMPPLYPSLKGSAIVTGPLKAHMDIVLNGKPGTAMQAFRDQLSDEELAAVITFERNSWGNQTGDIVQPQQIQEEKQQGPKP